MPFYRFQLRSDLSTQAVLERIQTLARERPGFGQSLKESFGWSEAGSPHFIGRVEGNGFKLYRDIRYRNSFLPRIRGYVSAYRDGTNIDVTMYLHPVVMVFMLFWLGGVGAGAVATFSHGKGAQALIPFGMFIFGAALTLGGFFPEAIKARRILEEHIDKLTA
jgi:hypothetical protein